MHTNCKNISEIDYRNKKWSKPFQCSIFWLRLSCCRNQTGFSYFTLLSVVWSRKQVQLHIPTPHISDRTIQNVCDTHDTLIQTHKFLYIYSVVPFRRTTTTHSVAKWICIKPFCSTWDIHKSMRRAYVHLKAFQFWNVEF